ncbi:MAG: hypothetical protein JG781_1653 [Peptococcaceae bacterium]|nr:hypothetical protein [Peptococcaceae bacterium]
MSGISQQLKQSLAMEEEAIRLGCSRSALLWAQDVIFDPRVGLKCSQNTCTHYGKNFMCPPFVPNYRDFRESVQPYRIALLLQKERELSPGLSPKEIDREFKEVSLFIHEVLLKLERQAFSQGFPFTLGLGSGNCKLCPTCGAKLGQEMCHKPGEARMSMEAVGIDVISTAGKVNFPVLFKNNLVSATGILFIT